MSLTMVEILKRAPVVPVIVIHDLAHAVPLAEALVAGGLPVLEVTLRTSAGLAAVEAMRRAVPEAIVGVGTTPQGELPGKSADEIAVDAFRLALEDAGLSKDSIDGLVTCRSFGGFGIDTGIARLAGLS